MTAHAPQFALSVDVEDYFQVWAFSGVIDRADWHRYEPRFEAATRRALDLFDRHGAKATFFTLAWAAERAPALMREIVARGHEIASHGLDHKKAHEMSADAFFEDVRRSRDIIENAAGARVIGYRAPGFSIDARTPFAHACIARAGYLYSSSTHPIAHDHYGDPDAPRAPYRPLAGDPLIEAPVATAEIFGKRFSCAGGGWFRAAPYAAFDALLERAAATAAGPLIFYFHPWELDPDQPVISAAPLKSRLRHYLNLAGMESKLGRLLGSRRWERIDAALGLHPVHAAAA